MTDIDQAIGNLHADTWDDVQSADESDDDTPLYDCDDADPLDRLEAYVDHCFETYPVVSNNLDREQVQTCLADWDRRRGQCKYNAEMGKRRFGKRVTDSKWRHKYRGHHAVFVATALVGVAPNDDNGAGWKACVRHELGHAIDYEKRGTSDHGPKFKDVMSRFGHDVNDGQHAHGYRPDWHK